ncbi:MAG: HhH-GPD-type base excision DNA repair protein [Candidatus Dormibacteria bacterium]
MPGFPAATVDVLPFAGEPAADRLLVADPMALLLGFLLDQQVPLERAFSAPRALRDRLGTISPAGLLALDQEAVERAFAGPPALHRFPKMMAQRALRLCTLLVDQYQGSPERVWEGALDAEDLRRRLLELPGMGPMKAQTLLSVLAKQLGVRPKGWERLIPDHPTLGDVQDKEGLLRYRSYKRSQEQKLVG